VCDPNPQTTNRNANQPQPIAITPSNNNHHQVAVKVMPKQRGNQARETTLSRLLKEVAVMQELQVRLRAVWFGFVWGVNCCPLQRLHAAASTKTHSFLFY
jgi:hypothetical protein